MQSRCAFSLVLLLTGLTACSPGVPPAIQGEWQPLVDAGGTRSVLTAAPGCPGPAYYEIGKSIFLHGPMRRETGRSPFSYGKETVQSVTGSNPVIISMERETKSGFVIAFSSTQPGPTYRFEADPGDADVQRITATELRYVDDKEQPVVLHRGMFTRKPDKFPKVTVPCAPEQEAFANLAPAELKGTWKRVARDGGGFKMLAYPPNCKSNAGSNPAALGPDAFVVEGGEVRHYHAGLAPGSPSEGYLVHSSSGRGPIDVRVMDSPGLPGAPWPAPGGLGSRRLTWTAKGADVWRITSTTGTHPEEEIGFYSLDAERLGVLAAPCPRP